MITILGADGTILYESPSVERILGYGPEDLVGRTIFDFVHPDDLERVSGLYEKSLASPGVRVDLRFRFRNANGAWRQLEAVAENLLGDPAVAGVVVNSRDITRRMETEKELQRSLERLLALYEAGEVLGSTLELDEIGGRLLTIMQRVSDLEAAAIYLPDEQQNLRAWRTVGSESLWRWAQDTPEARTARDFTLRTGDSQHFRLKRPNSTDRRRMAGLCLALQVRDRVVGVLEVYGPRSLLDTTILDSLAVQAASALENARLYGELAERERRLEELIGQLITAQEKERRRVAYEVHDGLTQVAVAAHQLLQAFAYDHPAGSTVGEGELDRVLELARQTVTEARSVTAALRPTALDDFGLAAAIRQHVESLRAEGWHIAYEENLNELRLPGEVETALYRVLQEALTNVRKHAQTKEAGVVLVHRNGRLRLEIFDPGCGFDPEAIPGTSGPGERIGLSSMRERVALLSGELTIRSRPRSGTTVVADIPLSGTGGGKDEK
ncbi:MAG: PAS domain S-box protein [Actinomycetota bacterium]|nr:PAS domain S-box protein [Actinomycetota bacterium]MDQ5818587.1 PAS domain S-box protein [Actinomycetota bacterium]